MCVEEFRPQTVRVRAISMLTIAKFFLPQELLCTGDEKILISHRTVEGKAWGRGEEPQKRAELRRERRG